MLCCFLTSLRVWEKKLRKNVPVSLYWSNNNQFLLHKLPTSARLAASILSNTFSRVLFPVSSWQAYCCDETRTLPDMSQVPSLAKNWQLACMITDKSRRKSRCQSASIEIFYERCFGLLVSDIDQSARLHSTFWNKVFGKNMNFVKYTYKCAHSFDEWRVQKTGWYLHMNDVLGFCATGARVYSLSLCSRLLKISGGVEG